MRCARRRRADTSEDEIPGWFRDLVVEIRSPGDSLPRLFRKIDDYIANGTRIAWLILPEDQCVFVLARNAPMRTALLGETLDGGEILPEFKIPVDDLLS